MKKKDDVVTKKYLDEALKDHSKTIIEAVNFGFEENKKDHKRLEDKIDKSWKSIDKYVKAQEAFREEFVVMKEEMRQIKQVIKEKLGVEIRAV
jgi:hypothetical protein